MPNLKNLKFKALDISGEDYFCWVLDAKAYLDSEGLGDTIKEGNSTESRDKAKALVFLRHHIHEDLKRVYLTEDPKELWTCIKDRYHDHQRSKAQYDWIHLRIQDFKSVAEYKSEMRRITYNLNFCGENITDAEMIEKTLSTFHPSNMILQTLYRGKGYKKYSELISTLLVAEHHNEILIKNNELRPAGSVPLPEANAVSGNYQGSGHNHSYGHGRGRGRGRKYGFGRGRGRGRSVSFKRSNHHQRWEKKNENKQEETVHDATNECYRCGSSGHWSQTCRTPKYLVDLYQQSLNQNG